MPLQRCLKPKDTSRQRDQTRRVIIPYFLDLSHKIKGCFKKAGYEVSLRPPPTLRSVLSKKKPERIAWLGLVYCIPCSNCNWSYVGETGRTLRESLTEHKRAVRNMSATCEISNHVLETGHGIHWNGAHTLSHESGRFCR